MTTDLHSRYAAAERLLPHQLRKLVFTANVQPRWIEDTDTFWYRRTTADSTEFVFVDPGARVRRPAFDHGRLAESLGTLLDQKVEPHALPFGSIEVRDGAVRFVVGTQKIEVPLDTYVATVVGAAPSPAESVSPDGTWAVTLRDHNLVLRNTVTGDERQLTSDGAESFSYATAPDCSANLVMQENLGFTMPPLVVWSPDSTFFATHRIDQRDLERMHLVRSAPADGGRPRAMSYRYALVGDEHLATAELFAFDVRTGEATQAKCEPFLTPYASPIMFGHVWWSNDSAMVYWLSGDRGDTRAWLRGLDPMSGDVRVLVEESSETTVQYGPHFINNNARVLSTGEVVWWSERSGWGHLYVYGAGGSVRQLTSGDWLVRDVVAVDEDSRTVVFTASGREPGVDLYVRQLYSVRLDGGEVSRLTGDALDHATNAAKSGRYYVDVQSFVDTPGVSVVRDVTGDVVVELEAGDASALHAAGYAPPERVVVKAADGVTDIYCAVFRPHGFDAARKYPVLDEIYPGPQIGALATRFPQSGGSIAAAAHGASFAALGFAVVVVEARGTPLRHKAFQEHTRVVRDGDFLDDHVAAIKQLAAERPWLDLDRVGIFGHSGGGYSSTRALLTFPDFYKVAVSSGGDHDDRAYHAMWGEKFYGMPDTFDYVAHANVTHVDKLTGKLFLIHGEMDDNVTPHLTMRLADALMAANKDFDLLIVPNADHAMLVHQAYWLRRRWDYFVQHLMGETPPEYRIADIPVDPETLAEMLGG